MANTKTDTCRVSLPESKSTSKSTVVNDCTEVQTLSEKCTVKGRYVWRIKNFCWLKLKQVGMIESEIFYTDPKDDLTWRMSISADEDLMCVRINLQDTCKEVEASYSMSILDENDAESSEGSMPTAFNAEKARSAISIMTMSYFNTPEIRNKLLPKGHLNILCQITRQVKLSKCGIARDLGLLFESGKLSDVKLAVNKVEFSAHRIVLASRSPVFASMFELNMIESNGDVVEISDIEPEVIKELLRFIYTEKVENLEVLGLELFAAADRFALEDLKLECEDVLCNSIDAENAVALLIYADLHASQRLKSAAREFIVKNAQKVAQTEGYKALDDGHQHLLEEILPINE